MNEHLQRKQGPLQSSMTLLKQPQIFLPSTPNRGSVALLALRVLPLTTGGLKMNCPIQGEGIY